jgi:hypothetical protein
MVVQVAHHLNLNTTAKDDMIVGVANGEWLPCLRVYSIISFSIHNKSFYIDFLIIAMEGYKVVLGCNWLCSLDPIIWDFTRLSMAFWRPDH